MVKGRNPGHICINLAHIARQSTIVGHPALLQMPCQSHAALPVNLVSSEIERLPGGITFPFSRDKNLVNRFVDATFDVFLPSVFLLTILLFISNSYNLAKKVAIAK